MPNPTHIRFQRSPDALYRRVGEEILLAKPELDDFDALSTTAAATWELLQNPRTLSDVVQLLAAAYAVSPQLISSEVEALLRDLLRRGWIEEADGDDG